MPHALTYRRTDRSSSPRRCRSWGFWSSRLPEALQAQLLPILAAAETVMVTYLLLAVNIQ